MSLKRFANFNINRTINKSVVGFAPSIRAFTTKTTPPDLSSIIREQEINLADLRGVKYINDLLLEYKAAVEEISESEPQAVVVMSELKSNIDILGSSVDNIKFQIDGFSDNCKEKLESIQDSVSSLDSKIDFLSDNTTIDHEEKLESIHESITSLNSEIHVFADNTTEMLSEVHNRLDASSDIMKENQQETVTLFSNVHDQNQELIETMKSQSNKMHDFSTNLKMNTMSILEAIGNLKFTAPIPICACVAKAKAQSEHPIGAYFAGLKKDGMTIENINKFYSQLADFSMEHGHYGLVEVLLKEGAYATNRPHGIFNSAVRNGNIVMINSLLSRGVSVHSDDIMTAVQLKQEAVLKILLAKFQEQIKISFGCTDPSIVERVRESMTNPNFTIKHSGSILTLSMNPKPEPAKTNKIKSGKKNSKK